MDSMVALKTDDSDVQEASMCANRLFQKRIIWGSAEQGLLSNISESNIPIRTKCY